MPADSVLYEVPALIALPADVWRATTPDAFSLPVVA